MPCCAVQRIHAAASRHDRAGAHAVTHAGQWCVRWRLIGLSVVRACLALCCVSTAVTACGAGLVVYEDSALVKAAQHGRVLVIDEADKAPLEVRSWCALECLVSTLDPSHVVTFLSSKVVAILKGLVEDGEMTLRLVDSCSSLQN
jgi:hypothetical protein